MKRIITFIFIIAVLNTIFFLQNSQAQKLNNEVVVGGQEVELSITFRSVDVYITTDIQKLAAYQIQIIDNSGRATLVGVEGSSVEQAYNHPPYYDQKALQSNQIILAAIAGDNKILPSGKIKVATLHYQIKGDAPVKLNQKLIALANKEQKKISGKLDLQWSKDTQ